MRFLSYIIVSLFIVISALPQDFGLPQGYVSDFAGVFTKDQELSLELKLLDYEKRTSIEVVVVTIKDIQETTLEDYANGLFNDWGIGKFHSDTGILIFLSLDTFDRGLRIEVGYGLEEFMTDYKVSGILSDVMPKLKNGEYSLALSETARLVISEIGTRSKEAREEYLAGSKEESERQTQQFIMGLIVIGGAVILFVIFFFIYKAMKVRKVKKQTEKQYKDATISNLNSLHMVFDETYAGVEQLVENDFYGAEDVLRKLKHQEKYIVVELPESLNTVKTHEEVVKIANDIDAIGNKLLDSASELFENHQIMNVVSNRLNTEIDNGKRKIEKLLPEMRQFITTINNENPKTIWRNFDYNNVDRNIEILLEKADHSVKYAFNSLDSNLYSEAKQHATDATNHINDAFTYVQSVFEANQMINDGKGSYNHQMGGLPDKIESTEASLRRSHVKSSTKDVMSDITNNYLALQDETKKGKDTDWIVVGALITFILSKCQETVVRASRDIREYEAEESRKLLEAKRRRDSRSSSYGGSSDGTTGRFL